MAIDFTATRARFSIPEGLIYLDGNSLGAMPKVAATAIAEEVEKGWGQDLIRSWNTRNWIDLPTRIGNRIARLVGAAEGTIIAADSTSINLFKVLTAALKLSGNRRVILSDRGNFPTDLYIAQGITKLVDQGYTLKLVAPEDVEAAIDDTVAVMMLTEVDYMTGRLHDMAHLTARAKAHGVVTIWDLAHSAGALPVDLAGVGADFAIGCGYKYLNGGPGAPAFVYVRPGLADMIEPALSGWLGHAAPFAFDIDYRPAPGVERMRAGTPPVLSMVALDAALTLWDGIDMNDIRARSLELTDRFIAEVEARCPSLALATPREHARRGSQVSFRHREGFAIMQALIADNVIGDFRAPEIIRFGFTPLYVSPEDVTEAAIRLARVIDEKRYERPEHQARGKVT